MRAYLCCIVGWVARAYSALFLTPVKLLLRISSTISISAKTIIFAAHAGRRGGCLQNAGEKKARRVPGLMGRYVLLRGGFLFADLVGHPFRLHLQCDDDARRVCEIQFLRLLNRFDAAGE